MKPFKTISTWLLQVVLGVLFMLIGTAKFMGPSWADKFERWGYPPKFHYVVGVVEALAGLALLVPRLTSHAASVLMLVMAAAAMTHLVHHEMRRLSAPLAYLVLLATVAWLRRPSALGLRVAPAKTAEQPKGLA